MNFTAVLPEYLPNVEYFLSFLPCKTTLIADHVQFRKRSSITRNSILQGFPPLSIPIKHNMVAKAIYLKEINFLENWNRKHLKNIQHSFNKAPYFDDFYPEICLLLEKPDIRLTDFLIRFIVYFLRKLKISTDIIQASDEKIKLNLEEGLIEFARKYNFSQYFYKEQHAEMGWINTEILNAANISTTIYAPVKSEEMAQLNILDFLFQFGPEAPFALRELV